jgi:hypothetical protein
VLVPRDLGDQAGEQGDVAGFLYLSTERPWPDGEDAFDRLPDEWFDDAGKLRSNRREQLPRRVVVRSDGSLDLAGGGATAGRGSAGGRRPRSASAWPVASPMRDASAGTSPA